MADRGYDTNEVIAYAVSNGMKLVMPPKKNQKGQREYGKEQCKLRHLAENAFLLLKRWREIAFSRQEHAVISGGCPNSLHRHLVQHSAQSCVDSI